MHSLSIAESTLTGASAHRPGEDLEEMALDLEQRCDIWREGQNFSRWVRLTAGYLSLKVC